MHKYYGFIPFFVVYVLPTVGVALYTAALFAHKKNLGTIGAALLIAVRLFIIIYNGIRYSINVSLLTVVWLLFYVCLLLIFAVRSKAVIFGILGAVAALTAFVMGIISSGTNLGTLTYVYDVLLIAGSVLAGIAVAKSINTQTPSPYQVGE